MKPTQIPYPVSIAFVLFGCALVFSLIAFVKGGPSSVLAAIAKSGFTAAFTLIFVSEIGDKVNYYYQGIMLFFSYRLSILRYKNPVMHEPFAFEANTMDMFIYAVLIINLIMKVDDLAKINSYTLLRINSSNSLRYQVKAQ